MSQYVKLSADDLLELVLFDIPETGVTGKRL